MARFVRRLHHRRGNRKLHPLAIVGICFGGAVLIALIIGNILNLVIKDTPSENDTAQTEHTVPDAEPQRTTQTVRAYPFVLGDAADSLLSEDGYTPEAVSVSLNTPDGRINYQSAVSDHLQLDANSNVDLKSAMQDLTQTVPYVCGVFYPQIPTTDDADLQYAVAAADAILLREFVHAGGSEILLVGVSVEENSLPYLADYVKQLKSVLGITPIGISVSMEIAAAEDSWETLPVLRPLADYLAVDLQDTPDAQMETALQNAKYYVDQYDMRLLLSADQTRWISVAETDFSDYQILSVPSPKEEAKG